MASLISGNRIDGWTSPPGVLRMSGVGNDGNLQKH